MSQAQDRSWCGRNWKWVVPVGCLVPLLVCGGGITLLITAVFGVIKSSEPYTEAVSRAEANPAVQAALGSPIETGFFVSGSINTHITNGVQTSNADLNIPISGPKGSATIHVVGNEAAGQWTYSTLEVAIPGQERPIDLLTDK